LLRPAGAAFVGLALLSAIAWFVARPVDPPRPPAPPKTASAMPAPVVLAKPPTQLPTATKPASGEPASPAPTFDVVRVGPTGDAVIAGRSAPGANIDVTANGRSIGHTTADGDGQWVLLPVDPIKPGGEELAVTAVTPAGTQTKGAAPVLVLVPEPPKLADGTAPSPAGASSAMAILMPPNAAPRFLKGPPPGEVRLGLDVVDYDQSGVIRFSGTAPPGVTVRVYIDNVAGGDAVADPTGHWSMTPASAVAVGAHQLRLDQISPLGRVAARVELPFQRASADAVAANDVPGSRIVVQPSQSLWRIARSAYGRGTDYLTIYQANRDQIRNPDLIYPGQVFALPVSAPAGASPNIPDSSSKSR